MRGSTNSCYLEARGKKALYSTKFGKCWSNKVKHDWFFAARSKSLQRVPCMVTLKGGGRTLFAEFPRRLYPRTLLYLGHAGSRPWLNKSCEKLTGGLGEGLKPRPQLLPELTPLSYSVLKTWSQHLQIRTFPYKKQGFQASLKNRGMRQITRFGSGELSPPQPRPPGTWEASALRRDRFVWIITASPLNTTTASLSSLRRLQKHRPVPLAYGTVPCVESLAEPWLWVESG